MRLKRIGRGSIKSTQHLSESALVIIGLMNMGIKAVAEIEPFLLPPPSANQTGRFIEKRRSEIWELIYEIATTEDPTVRRYVDRGLPPGISTPFPWPDAGRRAMCPFCHALVSSVPCLSCSVQGLAEHRPREGHAPYEGRRLPAVQIQPGPLKLKVFQLRLALGEPLFHPDDPTLAHEPHQ
ncbi:MAG: hypothetical protein ACYS5V_16800 [Planctomycetota bacterium]|jgi:hypothetical protein